MLSARKPADGWDEDRQSEPKRRSFGSAVFSGMRDVGQAIGRGAGKVWGGAVAVGATVADAVSTVVSAVKKTVRSAPIHRYFDDLEEEGPIEATSYLTVHPDKVLRQLGVIETHVRFRTTNARAFWDAKRRAWVDSVSHAPLPKPGVRARRKDRVAKGIIHVQGTYEGTDLGTDEAAALLHRRIEREKRAKALGDEAKAAGELAAAAAVPASELEPPEAALLRLQYLCNAVPEAALRTEACIIARGAGPLANLLSSGVGAVQDQGVGKKHSTAYRPGHVVLVGVNSARERGAVSKAFTHQVVLERKTCADAARSPHAPNSDTVYRSDESDTELMNVDYRDYCRLVPPGTAGNRRNLFRKLNPFSPKKRRSDDEDSGSASDAGEQKKPLKLLGSQQCTGFRCKHGEGNPHFQFVPNEGAVLPDVLCETRRGQVAPQLRRVCGCGTPLLPMEVAQCECGRFDFEHVPAVMKRQQLRALRMRNIPGFEDRDRTDKFLVILAYFMVEFPAPSEHEIDEWKHRFIDVLSKGFCPDISSRNLKKGMSRSVPVRPRIPVVNVLFGGHVREKFRLVKQVHKQWPIIVVQGSGGYADTIAGLVEKVNSIVQKRLAEEGPAGGGVRKDGGGGDEAEASGTAKVTAGLDDFRRFLSGIDPIAAEIIVNGRVKVVPRGTGVPELVRKVESCLTGNGVLDRAWFLYAQWNHNANRQEARFMAYKIFTTALAVVLTFLSVFQTFLLMITDSQKLEPEGSAQQVAKEVLTWSVIILPIILTATQAMEKHENPIIKMVTLRSCSERLLSEIYMYRTRTCAYGKDSLRRRARDGLDGESAEAMLQLQTTGLIDVLSSSSVSSVTLEPYDGLVPPEQIRRTGDTGGEFLSPDDYVLYRLEACVKTFEDQAWATSARLSFLQTLSYVMNIAGTILGATNVIGLTYIAVWVILAVVVETNISKSITSLRIPMRLKRINVALLNLAVVSTNWAALGSSADRQHNRDQLVQQTEDIILDVGLMWESIIDAPCEQKNPLSAGGRRGLVSDEKKKRDEEAMKLNALSTSQGVDLDLLTTAGLSHALSEDTGQRDKDDVLSQVRRVERVLRRKQETAGEPPEAADSDASAASAAPEPLKARRGQRRSAKAAQQRARQSRKEQAMAEARAKEEAANRPVKDIGAIDLPQVMVEALEPGVRRAILTALRPVVSHGLQVSADKIMKTLAAAAANPWLERELQPYATRKLLEFAKYVAVLDLYATFPPDIGARMQARVVANNKELLGKIGEECDTNENAVAAEIAVTEFLLCFLIPMAAAGAAESKDAEDERLVAVAHARVREPSMRKYVKRVVSDKDLAELMRTAGGWTAANSPQRLAVDFYDAVTTRIAELDVGTFLENGQNRFDLLSKVAALDDLVRGGKWQTFTQATLLRYLPRAIGQRVNQKVSYQLGKYIEQFAQGTPSTRIFKASHEKYDRLLKRRDGLVFHPVKGNKELRERLVLAASELDQVEINRLNKPVLRRRFALSPACDAAVLDTLFDLPVHDIKLFLSVLQVKMNSTYAFKVIDRLGDDDAIDIKPGLLACCAERLTDKVSEFATLKLHKLTKRTILIRMESKTVTNALSFVSDDGLRALVEAILDSTHKLYPLMAYKIVRTRLPFLQDEERFRKVTACWGADFITRMVDGVAAVNINEDAAAADDDDDDDDDDGASAGSSASHAASLGADFAPRRRTSLRGSFVVSGGGSMPGAEPAAPRVVVRNPCEFVGNIDFDTVRVELKKVLALCEEGAPRPPGTGAWVPQTPGELLGCLAEAINDFVGDASLAQLFEQGLFDVLSCPHVQPASAPSRRRPRGRLSRLSVTAGRAASPTASPRSPRHNADAAPGGIRVPEVTLTPDGLFVHLTEMLLGSHERRLSLLAFLASLESLEMHVLFADMHAGLAALDAALAAVPSAAGLASVELQSQLLVLRGGVGEQGFASVMAYLINTLVYGAPLQLFYQLAADLAICDIRDVLSGAKVRRSFIFFLYDVFHYNPPSLDCPFAHDAATAPSYDFLGLPPPPAQPPHGPGEFKRPGEWKTRLLAEAQAFPTGARHAHLLEQLRTLTETQLRAVLDLARPLISATPVGQFFGSFVAKARATCAANAGRGAVGDPTLPTAYEEWLLLHEMTYALRQKARPAVADVTALLGGYVGAEFVRSLGAATPQLEARLAQLELAPEELALLCALGAEQLDRRFFSYLRHDALAPPVPRRVYVATKRKAQRRLWGELGFE